MDLLGSLGILVRVVETGSFSAVAREREDLAFQLEAQGIGGRP